MASMDGSYANCFRLAAELTDEVAPGILQAALDRTAPRFPCIAAAIRPVQGEYRVFPAESVAVFPWSDFSAYMSREDIAACGVRVLCGGRRIALDCFHSLTDGHGASVFLGTLLAEYVAARYGVKVPRSNYVLDVSAPAAPEELADDYRTYAACKGRPADRTKAYQLPVRAGQGEGGLDVVSRVYDADGVRAAARRQGITVTLLLHCAMFKALADVAGRSGTPGAFQVFLPVNMRSIFGSDTLRNFSLYTLPRLTADECRMDVSHMAELIARQLAQQSSAEYLSQVMATNVRAQDLPILKALPLRLRDAVTRWAVGTFGDRNSCLTLSNLGVVGYPQELLQVVEEMGLCLSPRKRGTYNCAILTCKARMVVNFSCRGDVSGLPDAFFTHLDALL